MNLPLISVVIPTFRRPALLPRAVASCLEGMAPGEVEVIVVPNGADASWQQSLAQFRGNHAVRVAPIDIAHPSFARNAGLAAARGTYVRFLDDDDYLFPESAKRQLAWMQAAGLDACSAPIEVIDEHGEVSGSLHAAHPSDFVCSMLAPGRMTIPLAHIFRTDMVSGVLWQAGLPYLEDVEWMLRVGRLRPQLKWAVFPESVGVWYQHSGPRESPGLTSNVSQTLLVSWIRETIGVLASRGQLDGERRSAAASGLWHCVHRAFQFSPGYWTRVAKEALALDPLARPKITVFGRDLGKSKHVLALEWLAIGPRLISHGSRRAYFAIAGAPFRRDVR
jgi:hypothetical protein